MIAMAQGRATIARWRGALARACARITRHVALATFAIALALHAWSLFDAAHSSEPAPPLAAIFASSMIVNVLIAFSMMFTTFVADEYVAIGAPPLPVYASGILIGSALGTLGQWLVHEALRRSFTSVPGVQTDAAGVHAVFVFSEYLIWGTIGVWIYVNRRGEMRAKARMDASRLQRVQIQRRALEAQLQALQARIEPRFLLETLASVRDRYAGDKAAGSATLGALITYLRAALPQLREASSHLAREIDLVRAYVDAMRACATAPVDFDARMPDELAHARMPPMMLLPLVNLAVRRHSARQAVAMRMTASGKGTRLRVSLSCTCDCLSSVAGDAAAGAIRERLHALYGSESELAFDVSGAGSSAIIEIPLESTDSHHR